MKEALLVTALVLIGAALFLHPHHVEGIDWSGVCSAASATLLFIGYGMEKPK